ncbi:30S ribosomal protein S12 methylthiotransferase RimO [Williamwhitmania taraxaci]|uniref:Ribosomal protein uS12 methylthiotransferase RimO n=1 Tax=Williamwhitmania taraxaci TaxID=1640674 RepID=A0A1G6HJ51_9BACT|nr:30S ribosomal protein S12 methylthiotransferase RimO [Williamwhitmania taraxaci]SDB94280.1 SSU ribosomal protein S12P methylthiotransferase [Williamwhitmania taraxaci]
MGSKSKTVNVVTLGCSKNIVDSEQVMRQLTSSGFSVVHNSDDLSKSNIVLINTCGFIGDAKEESIEMILKFAEAKKSGQIDKIFVFGCLSQRYREELSAEMPEIDGFFGVNELKTVVKVIGAEYRQQLLNERELTTPDHYAYLKISEGCSWGCSYCAIPLIRGKHVSRRMEDLVVEAQLLAKKGVRELIVIAQDSTYYGQDIYGKRRISELLTELSSIDGIEWIRLHYAFPSQFPEELIETIANNPKICNYLDIPFQHISDTVLLNMRRGISMEETYTLIEKLRKGIPNLALRTTLLVGHPGEGIDEFDELCRFVTKVKFDRLGVFPYSEEEGTYGAKSFQDTIPLEEKLRRAGEIMKLQQNIAEELNRQKIGSVIRVIIDQEEADFYIGRTEHDSPEVDGEVMVKKGDFSLICGEFYNVKIMDSIDYDLIGDVIL